MDNLIGHIFNGITVLKFDEDRYNADNVRKANGEITQARKKYICRCHCGKITVIDISHIKEGRQKSCGLCYTFYDWCVEHSRQDLLDRWDYELNDKSPEKVPAKAKGKYYFKCPNGIHSSENMSTMANITGHGKFRLDCRACNSIGQRLMDRDRSLDAWSDKNKVDPFTVSRQANKKFWIKCRDCEEEKYIILNDYIRNGLRCWCGDGLSYPEKFMISLLKQLKIDFIYQYTKTKSEWVGDFKYDFYIPSMNMIIETHGEQHYIEKHKNSNWGITLEEQQEIDRQKEELALLNGIDRSKYITIDCRSSYLNFIKQSVLESNMSNLFMLEDINWGKVGEDANKNIVKEVCDYWCNKNNYETASSLCDKFNIERGTVVKYLKIGSDLGWCNYSAEEEILKRKKNMKHMVRVIKDGEILGIHESATRLSNESPEIYGTKFTLSKICECMRNEIKSHKGYVFERVI